MKRKEFSDMMKFNIFENDSDLEVVSAKKKTSSIENDLPVSDTNKIKQVISVKKTQWEELHPAADFLKFLAGHLNMAHHGLLLDSTKFDSMKDTLIKSTIQIEKHRLDSESSNKQGKKGKNKNKKQTEFDDLSSNVEFLEKQIVKCNNATQFLHSYVNDRNSNIKNIWDGIVDCIRVYRIGIEKIRDNEESSNIDEEQSGSQAKIPSYKVSERFFDETSNYASSRVYLDEKKETEFALLKLHPFVFEKSQRIFSLKYLDSLVPKTTNNNSDLIEPDEEEVNSFVAPKKTAKDYSYSSFDIVQAFSWYFQFSNTGNYVKLSLKKNLCTYRKRVFFTLLNLEVDSGTNQRNQNESNQYEFLYKIFEFYLNREEEVPQFSDKVGGDSSEIKSTKIFVLTILKRVSDVFKKKYRDFVDTKSSSSSKKRGSDIYNEIQQDQICAQGITACSKLIAIYYRLKNVDGKKVVNNLELCTEFFLDMVCAIVLSVTPPDVVVRILNTMRNYDFKSSKETRRIVENIIAYVERVSKEKTNLYYASSTSTAASKIKQKERPNESEREEGDQEEEYIGQQNEDYLEEQEFNSHTIRWQYATSILLPRMEIPEEMLYQDEIDFLPTIKTPVENDHWQFWRLFPIKNYFNYISYNIEKLVQSFFNLGILVEDNFVKKTYNESENSNENSQEEEVEEKEDTEKLSTSDQLYIIEGPKNRTKRNSETTSTSYGIDLILEAFSKSIPGENIKSSILDLSRDLENNIFMENICFALSQLSYSNREIRKTIFSSENYDDYEIKNERPTSSIIKGTNKFTDEAKNFEQNLELNVNRNDVIDIFSSLSNASLNNRNTYLAKFYEASNNIVRVIHHAADSITKNADIRNSLSFKHSEQVFGRGSFSKSSLRKEYYNMKILTQVFENVKKDIEESNNEPNAEFSAENESSSLRRSQQIVSSIKRDSVFLGLSSSEILVLSPENVFSDYNSEKEANFSNGAPEVIKAMNEINNIYLQIPAFVMYSISFLLNQYENSVLTKKKQLQTLELELPKTSSKNFDEVANESSESSVFFKKEKELDTVRLYFTKIKSSVSKITRNVFDTYMNSPKSTNLSRFMYDLEESLPIRIKNDVVTQVYSAYEDLISYYENHPYVKNIYPTLNGSYNRYAQNQNNLVNNLPSNSYLIVLAKSYKQSLDAYRSQGPHAIVYSQDINVLDAFSGIVASKLTQSTRSRPYGGAYIQQKAMIWTMNAESDNFKKIEKYVPKLKAFSTKAIQSTNKNGKKEKVVDILSSIIFEFDVIPAKV